jgi:hypothetical protein
MGVPSDPDSVLSTPPPPHGSAVTPTTWSNPDGRSWFVSGPWTPRRKPCQFVGGLWIRSCKTIFVSVPVTPDGDHVSFRGRMTIFVSGPWAPWTETASRLWIRSCTTIFITGPLTPPPDGTRVGSVSRLCTDSDSVSYDHNSVRRSAGVGVRWLVGRFI